VTNWINCGPPGRRYLVGMSEVSTERLTYVCPTVDTESHEHDCGDRIGATCGGCAIRSTSRQTDLQVRKTAADRANCRRGTPLLEWFDRPARIGKNLGQDDVALVRWVGLMPSLSSTRAGVATE
jgi:hypothetical protein